jgi:hypothetical protein
MPNKARLYIDSTITVGIIVLTVAALTWRPSDLVRYSSYFVLGLVASTLKVRLARIRGTISGGFLFVLIAIAEFSFAETIFMAWSTGLVQCFWKVKRRQARRQLLFNLATLGNGAALAYSLPRFILNALGYQSIAIILLIAATLYYWANNISVLTALALVEDKPIEKIWQQCSLWSYWYFIAQAALAGFVSVCIHARGWVFSLLLIVLSIAVYLTFKRIAKFFITGKLPIRKAKRYDAIDSTAEAIWMDRHGNEHNTAVRILNVSELGMQIESPEPFSTSTIHIVAPAHGIDATGEVCYCEFTSGKYMAGIELHLVLTQRQLMSLLYTRGSSDLTDRG